MEELLVKEMDTRYSSTACVHDCCLRTVLCITSDQSSDSLILLIKTNGAQTVSVHAGSVACQMRSC